MKPATSILVIHPATGHVLGATRRGSMTDWGTIGGKQDTDETILECAMREFFEETGISLTCEPGRFYQAECLGEVNYLVDVFVVYDYFDIQRIVEKFDNGPIEVEPGIHVGFVPFTTIMSGSFAEFNRDLHSRILMAFSTSFHHIID